MNKSMKLIGSVSFKPRITNGQFSFSLLKLKTGSETRRQVVALSRSGKGRFRQLSPTAKGIVHYTLAADETGFTNNKSL